LFRFPVCSYLEAAKKRTDHSLLSGGPLSVVGEIVDSSRSHLSISAENAEKPTRAKVLAEPSPGTVAQGVVLVIANDVSRL
jgi:hypothetical protein